MGPLTKAAEQKLIAAIENAAGLVNGGMAPNDAIVKSASEANIPAGHLNLMVHAYNTGRTTKQREAGSDTLEKAADFQLADVDAVRERLFPAAVKTSAEIARDHVVSTDYAVSPAGMLQRRKAAMAKEAAAAVALPEKTWAPPPRDEQAAARKAASAKRAAELVTEEVRRRSTVAYSKAAAAMEELHMYFRHPGNISFQDAKREADLRLGREGVAVLEKLSAVYPHLEKQAETRQMYFGDLEPIRLVSQVIAAVETYNAAHAQVPVKQAAFGKKEAPEILTGSILRNPSDEPLTLKSAAPASPAGGGVGGSKPAPRKPSPSAGGGGGGDFLNNVMSAPRAIGGALASIPDQLPGAQKSPSELKSDAYANLTDPAHDNELRNIRAQGVLHDLVVNDPVISGYDPQEVAMAFNELADLSPDFVDSPSVMQALLRKRLEAGQMADFDIKQLIDMDKTRADADLARMQTQRVEKELLNG